jgi:cytochrome b561
MNNSTANVLKSIQEPKAAYTSTSRGLHWSVAILIFGMFALGWYMTAIEDDAGSDWYFMLHKSIGIVVLLLVVTRLFWRFGNTPPLLPAQLPRWQVAASKVSHWLLYGTMIAMPLAGLLGALLSKDGLVFFGFQLPRMFSINHDLSESLFSAHSTIAWVLVGLITLHVLAALKHLFVNRDGVFQRM